MPQTAPDRDDLRHLIDPICTSCNDVGCNYCAGATDDDLTDIPPDMRNPDYNF